MPKDYWFHCSNCTFETFRYRNFKKCPQCAGDMIREEPLDFHAACFACGSRKDLEMFAHRDDRSRMVGWLFACQKCVGEIADSDLEIHCHRRE